MAALEKAKQSLDASLQQIWRNVYGRLSSLEPMGMKRIGEDVWQSIYPAVFDVAKMAVEAIYEHTTHVCERVVA